jgi:hypothetical protein
LERSALDFASMKDRTRCATLLGGVALLVLASALMSTWHVQARETSIDVAAWVARWPTRFDLSGGKSEPTYVEAINIDRRGNVFTAVGGAPAWEQRSVERVSIDSSGNVTHLVCPSGLNCDAGPGVNFLSSAWLLAAFRKHASRGESGFLGRAVPLPYGARQVVCIQAERVGATEAVLDPCFDLETGAVLAQRHRLSGRFDGPSLDPGSIRISFGAKS